MNVTEFGFSVLLACVLVGCFVIAMTIGLIGWFKRSPFEYVVASFALAAPMQENPVLVKNVVLPIITASRQ